MWKALSKLVAPVMKRQERLLAPETLLQQQLRTTFILKRKTQPYLHKKGHPAKRLKSRHYIYELVEDTIQKKQPDIEVILTSYFQGLGEAGDRVVVKRNFAYNNLLLPGLAVYASPENREIYKEVDKARKAEHSSPTAERAVNLLSSLILSVVVNKEMPWTLQPWHVKACFRKSGFHVPEEAITMPSKPISGPNMDLENKEFYVTVTVNNFEKVQVRCRIHHWSTLLAERLPHMSEFWKEQPEAIFPEDAPVLASLHSAAAARKKLYGS